jgi:hypothetical protein
MIYTEFDRERYSRRPDQVDCEMCKGCTSLDNCDHCADTGLSAIPLAEVKDRVRMLPPLKAWGAG